MDPPPPQFEMNFLLDAERYTEEKMKVGGASWSGVIDADLTKLEKTKLKAIVGDKATTRFIRDLEKTLKVLESDGFEANAASWGETRPEMEAFVALLDKFMLQYMEYSNARLGSPKSAAIFLACDPLANFEGNSIDDLENDALHYTELRDVLKSFHRRAKKNLIEKIEDAKARGRPSDTNFGQLIFDMLRLLDEHKISFGITTDRESNELTSPFWSLVIEIVSRVRDKPNAGFNSEQAVLQRVKRDLRKFREKYPPAEGSKG